MPQRGHLSEPESEPEDEITEEIYRQEHHKKTTEDYERKIREEYEEEYKPARMPEPEPEELQAPVRRQPLPQAAIVKHTHHVEESEVLAPGELQPAPQTYMQQLPQVGVVAKTKLPERGYISEPESEPEDITDEIHRREHHKKTTEEHERIVKEGYEEIYKQAPAVPMEAPKERRRSLPQVAVMQHGEPEKALVEPQPESLPAPPTQRHPLPQAGIMSKTQTLQRGYVSEPEEEPEPEPEYIVEPVTETRRYFEDIHTEEEHKKLTEDYEIKVKRIIEEAPAPIAIKPTPETARITREEVSVWG